ncbi:MAG: RtcB family protein [Actinomycetota bacterium]|nr:RtcB family protein [Actinomycetota bacterium]
MEKITNSLLSWATDIDAAVIDQAHRAARLPIVHDHVALMPDAHIGIGATVGSVIPTKAAIIPAAVGVDIGCGMAAIRTDLVSSQLPDDLAPLLREMERFIPAGVGAGHGPRQGERGRAEDGPGADAWFAANPLPSDHARALATKARTQFGSLGSGNHFAEVCLDEQERVWLFLHSGSRGIGNMLATRHIDTAKKLRHQLPHAVEDPALAWFVQGTPEFQEYIADMLWCQAYALANRDAMLAAFAKAFFRFVGSGRERERINCHHNFAALEQHGDEELWITRKGAISARSGQLGLIPGSMGTRSYVVRGLGNPLSWQSCSHGAGRRFSRTEAKRRYTVADLKAQMGDRTWLSSRADRLVDEIPSAYKDIDEVMAAQRDLVEVVHTLRQIVNYKGC